MCKPKPSSECLIKLSKKLSNISSFTVSRDEFEILDLSFSYQKNSSYVCLFIHKKEYVRPQNDIKV